MDNSTTENSASTSAAPARQACREQNIQTIVDFIMTNVKDHSNRIGIELEHLIVSANGGERVSYSQEHGIADLLERLSEVYPDKTFSAEGDLIGLSRTRNGLLEAITLEPAGQLELSAGPFNDLSAAKTVFDDFEDRLSKYLEPNNQIALLLGYMPVGEAADMEMIPKHRYEYMDAHFKQIGPYGTCMMRGSAAAQISIDFFSEEDCIRKMRLAAAAAPIISLMCDNTSIFEGEMRTHAMIRTEIWNGVDKDRCGVVPGLFDKEFGVADYAAYVLDVPAIVAPDGNGGWKSDERTFGEIYADMPMDEAAAEHALSMVFPDVRLKRYIEIRSADAMQIKYTIALAALVKGIFANDDAMEALEKMFSKVTERDIAKAKLALMREGFDAEVYGIAAWKIAEQLNVIAKLQLNKEEREMLEPLTTLAFSHTTLADWTVFE